jgi:hypothetical protein
MKAASRAEHSRISFAYGWLVKTGIGGWFEAGTGGRFAKNTQPAYAPRFSILGKGRYRRQVLVYERCFSIQTRLATAKVSQ